MTAEREAEERALYLRAEVEALEAEAEQREHDLAAMVAKKAAEREARKAVEADRFYEALRSKLREEAAHLRRPIPPLCACGLDPLENHTEKCARNCIFYKNPAAYGRALSGLFVRPIVLD